MKNKYKIKKGSVLGRCADCNALQIQTQYGAKWQGSFVIFEAIQCMPHYGCVHKRVDMGTTTTN